MKLAIISVLLLTVVLGASVSAAPTRSIATVTPSIKVVAKVAGNDAELQRSATDIVNRALSRLPMIEVSDENPTVFVHFIVERVKDGDHLMISSIVLRRFPRETIEEIKRDQMSPRLRAFVAAVGQDDLYKVFEHQLWANKKPTEMERYLTNFIGTIDSKYFNAMREQLRQLSESNRR
jgi:hypothetical protein